MTQLPALVSERRFISIPLDEYTRLRAIERHTLTMFRGANVWNQKRYANLRTLYRLVCGVSAEETTYDPCAVVIEDLREALTSGKNPPS